MYDDLVRDLPEALNRRTAKARRVDIGEGQPGIVDEYVEAAETGTDLGDDAVAFLGFTQIGDKRPDPVAELLFRGSGVPLRDVGFDVPDRRDAVPGLCQTQCHRAPQTAQPARNDRNALFH